jgi:hypothetical protein
MIRRNISLFAKEAVDSVILDLRNEGRNGLADWLTDRKNLHWAYLTAHKAESGVLGKDVFTSIVESGRFVTHYAGDESFATKTETTLNAVDRTGETERGVPAYPQTAEKRNTLSRIFAETGCSRWFPCREKQSKSKAIRI